MTEQRASPLDSPEISVKLFVADAAGVRLKELIPVFHRWIKQDLLEDELAIDVANYEHVPKGPGVVLICDRAHYYFDERAGRAGLRYRGRREARASGTDVVTGALRSALQAARLLESDPVLEGRYRFRTDELELGINDRLLAPSEQATVEAVRVELGEAVRGLWGVDDVTLELSSGPREPFLATVKTGASPSVEELLGRLAAAKA
ncbi:MAG TPA: hypothetical protein VMM35_10635 [Longimicrobiales bacterium]|nr:hypothetical protein [Longimicrobiales bacterium]